MYEGLSSDIFKEYTGSGAPLGQYYTANGFILGRKMFGNHGLTGRDTGLKTNGGMMYYTYDGMRNVTALTDHNDGSVIEQYRYDAFGSLYTGVTAPYNTAGFAGRQYDPKASLMDMSARWYAPQTGRFITPDPYGGDLLTPYTQNRYAYVGNNPINRWDPTGYWEAGDENRSQAAQDEITRLTTLWDNTNDPVKKAQYHADAEEVRRLDSLRLYSESEVYSHTTTNESTSYGSRDKGSDGWYTDWTKTVNINDIYNIYSIAKNGYSNEIVSQIIIGIRTNTTKNITTGINFEAFSAGEWYVEHKDDLLRYGTPPPPYIPRDDYSCETGSITINAGSTTNRFPIKTLVDNALKGAGIPFKERKDSIDSTGLPLPGVLDKETYEHLKYLANLQKAKQKTQGPGFGDFRAIDQGTGKTDNGIPLVLIAREQSQEEMWRAINNWSKNHDSKWDNNLYMFNAVKNLYIAGIREEDFASTIDYEAAIRLMGAEIMVEATSLKPMDYLIVLTGVLAKNRSSVKMSTTFEKEYYPAIGSINRGKAALDANALILGLEKGEIAALDKAIAGRTPVISITAAKEFLKKGDVNILRKFLEERGGYIGKAATQEQIANLQSQAQVLGRVLRTKDAAVAGSAIQEGAPLLTRDSRLLKFLQQAGIDAVNW